MAVESEQDFRSQLLAAGLLVECGAEGIYARSAVFEQIVSAIDRLITAEGADLEASVLHFPPVMARSVLEQAQYVRSFPDLVGSINVFEGDDATHLELLKRLSEGAGWGDLLTPSDVVLCSAGCHLLYPCCSGSLPAQGRQFEIFGHCFRQEPSPDPARMRSFRMHEFVYLGSADGAIGHRDTWLERSARLLSGLGLAVEAVISADAFFGRIGKLLSANQRAAALKHEIVASTRPGYGPTALASCNYHLDHFGHFFGITLADGSPAHSACVGFGPDRIAVALLAAHGTDPTAWPAQLHDQLSP